MRRVVIDRPGGYQRLTLQDAPDPQPGPGEVAIEVRAIGVNFADCIARMGLYASAHALKGYPLTPGFEVAGTVAALGAGVDDLALGEPVLAVTVFDAYQTRVALPRAQVARLPEGWTLEQGACFPTAFLTAWYALHELAALPTAPAATPATLLVHSAAGGVGQALCQLGRRAGARVIGVVGSAAKVEAARAAGAEDVIAARGSALWRELDALAPGGCDLICDATGGATLRGSYQHLAPGGRLIVYGFHSLFARGGSGRAPWPRLLWGWLHTPRFDPLAMTQANRSVLAFNLSFLGHRHDLLARGLGTLLGWAARGELRPLPVTAFRFEDCATAQRALESGTTTGKLVLQV